MTLLGFAEQEAQLYLHPAWSSYERAPLQQPAWRQACSGPELGMCTAGDVLLAASCSQPAQALSPYRRPAALFPPALPQDSPADLDPLDPRFLAHISDPSEHLVRPGPLCQRESVVFSGRKHAVPLGDGLAGHLWGSSVMPPGGNRAGDINIAFKLAWK